MPVTFDLILKNGKCFIDGKLKIVDIGISGEIIKKMLDTLLDVGRIPIILIADLITSLLEVTAPATKQSASSHASIAIAKCKGSFINSWRLFAGQLLVNGKVLR